ncbi:pyridoxamine 5'-phosphate oxidase family protein [Phytoactinopolyspora halotolerans]|uniref:Pyridoxamine 5'-phosphate oxidase family protein n=1 Tax=Phytoactinopolyspora halotolerans TaxID=1981512 RepID=A0A6L9S170_9ACTN|nr:pyridoxamine 5'-phosphate oxidase family protein [Phytoactinopolyspora halotolerans]NED98915.1 pyridoxamine 5'-phosphate oxidase family protein [Phytoactinopolyspora halotolerans]
MNAEARSRAQRIRDTLHRLEHDVDCWVATAGDAGGSPYMIPLSFLWDGDCLLLANPKSSITSRNLSASGKTRIGIGHTRDVVMIEGMATPVHAADLPPGVADAFAAKAGFDPRALTGYLYFRVRPQRIQAWREVNELDGRDLMRDGRWLTAG